MERIKKIQCFLNMHFCVIGKDICSCRSVENPTLHRLNSPEGISPVMANPGMGASRTRQPVLSKPDALHLPPTSSGCSPGGPFSHWTKMAAVVPGSLADPTSASNRKHMASSQTFSIEQAKPSPGISLKISTFHWPGLCHMLLPKPMIDGPRLPKLRPEASQIAKTNLGVF